MNYVKAQENIFKALIRGDRVYRFDLDEKSTFVTPDGFKGWVFPNDVLMINVEKIQEFKPLEIVSIIKPENKLDMTLEFRLASSHSKELLRKFTSDTKTVFVKEAFLAMFQNPSFYQELDKPIGHIVVTEEVRGVTKPVGVVLPVRINAPDFD